MKIIRNTKQKIIEAAGALFVTHGFGNVSMDAVAEAAGFTKATVYQHVKSKEELLLDCLKWRLASREAHLERYFAARRGSINGVLGIFSWMALKGGRGAFHGCAFLKAAAEMAPTLPAVRTIALEAKRLLRDRIVTLLAQAEIEDPDHIGDVLALLLEGAQALSLLEQTPRAFTMARCAAAAWLSLHAAGRPAAPSAKIKAQR